MHQFRFLYIVICKKLFLPAIFYNLENKGEQKWNQEILFSFALREIMPS